MSSRTLQITLQAFVQGLQQVGALSERLREVARNASSTGEAAQNGARGIGSLDAVSKAGSSSVAALSGALKSAAAAYVAFLSVSSLGSAANLAARNQTLAVTLAIVGRNAGYTKAELEKYEGQVRALGITTEAARNSITQMIQAGLALGPVVAGGADQVSLMARAAQDLAVVMGGDSSETFQRMITNIQQLDTMGLRFMGVVVDLQEANEKYAVSIGKTASALTKQEQQQALANATLDKAKGFMGAYEASMETVGKKLSSLTRLQKDASEAIGNILLPAFGVIVDSASAVLKEITKWANALGQSGVAAEALKSVATGLVTIFSQVAGAISGAVGTIATAVQLAASKMGEAFSGLSVGGIISGFQELVPLVARFAASAIGVIGDVAPTFRVLVDTVYEFAIQLKDAVVSLASLGEASQSAAAWATILRTALGVVGFIVASLSDGFTVVQYVAQAAFGAIMIGVGSAAKVTGALVGLVNENLGQAYKDMGDNALEMGFKSVEASNKIEEAMLTNGSAVGRFLEKLDKIPTSQEKATQATDKFASASKEAYNGLDEKVTLFTKAVEQNGLRGAAAVKQYDALKAEVTRVGKEYGLSEKQIAIFNNRLDSGKAKAQDASVDLKTLGLTMSELKTKTSDAGAQMVSAFNGMVRAANFTSEQLRVAFTKGLDSETTIRGLIRFKEAAEQAFKDGALSAEDYSAALEGVNAKFGELFDAALKSANSKTALKDLRSATEDVGKAGAVAGSVMTAALTDIAQKAGGASSALLEVAQAATELEKQKTSISQASLGVSQAELAVRKAQNDVTRAEVEFKRTGSELDKAVLENAKAQQVLAQAKLELSRAKYKEELASMDALIAKQKQLEAQKNLETNKGDPGAIAKAEAAEREAKATQLTVEATRQATQEAERHVIASEKNVIATQEVADNLKEGAEASKAAAAGAAQANKQFLDGMAEMFNTINNSGKAMEDLGYSAKEAAEIMAEAKRNAFAAPPLGLSEAIDNLFQVMDNLNKKAEEFKQQMGTAEQFAADYEAAAKAAEDMAAAGGEAAKSASKMGGSIDAVSAVYEKIAASAWRVVDAAIKSGEAFTNSAGSIREELLRAQGKEEEVAALRYANRQKELAIEYKMLDLKLLAAEMTAKAAGIKDTGIENARREAAATYNQAKSDLVELEKLEIAKIRKTKQEQAEKDREAKANAARQQQEAAAQAAGKAINAARESSSSVGIGKGYVDGLVESGGGKSVSSTTNITVNVDGKDLLSEEQIRKKIVPTLDAISARSK